MAVSGYAKQKIVCVFNYTPLNSIINKIRNSHSNNFSVTEFTFKTVSYDISTFYSWCLLLLVCHRYDWLLNFEKKSEINNNKIVILNTYTFKKVYELRSGMRSSFIYFMILVSRDQHDALPGRHGMPAWKQILVIKFFDLLSYVLTRDLIH